MMYGEKDGRTIFFMLLVTMHARTTSGSRVQLMTMHARTTRDSRVQHVLRSCMHLCQTVGSVGQVQYCQCLYGDQQAEEETALMLMMKWPSNPRMCNLARTTLPGYHAQFNTNSRRCLLQIHNTKLRSNPDEQTERTKRMKMKCVMCTEVTESPQCKLICRAVERHTICTQILQGQACVLTTRKADNNSEKGLKRGVNAGRLHRGDVVVVDTASACSSDKQRDRVHCEDGLHAAFKAGNKRLVKILVKRRPEKLNCQSGSKRRTPLMHAARYGLKDAFDLLVGLGTDLTLRDKYNASLFLLAASGGNIDIARPLMEMGMDIEAREGHHNRTPILCAAMYCREGMFQYLIGLGCDFHKVTETGGTVLHKASVGGCTSLIARILKMNVSGLGLEDRDADGWTALHSAAFSGEKSTVEYLVSRGGDVLARTNLGDTLLHMAAEFGSLDMVKYVVSLAVIQPDCKNDRAETPIMLAQKREERYVGSIIARFLRTVM